MKLTDLLSVELVPQRSRNAKQLKVEFWAERAKGSCGLLRFGERDSGLGREDILCRFASCDELRPSMDTQPPSDSLGRRSVTKTNS